MYSTCICTCITIPLILNYESQFLETPTVPELSQAQVILNGLNSLFETCEQQTLDMLDRVEEITIPDEWKATDLVKQTKDVMVCITVQ